MTTSRPRPGNRPLAASFFVAGCAALVNCAGDPQPEAAACARWSITGGSPVAAGAHGAVAALGLVDGAGEVAYHCTAVLIAPGAALTAAHCLTDDPAELRLLFGDTTSSVDSPSVVRVDRQVSDPLWVGVGNEPLGVGQANDLAVLSLSEMVEDIAPLPLLRPADVAPTLRVGQPVVLVGFGAAAPDGVFGVKRVGHGARIVEVGDFELRISYPGEPQACEGDSGGPALAELAGADGSMRAFLVGTVSRAVASADEQCDVGAIYARVDAHEALIEEQVLLPCGSGPAAPCADAGAGLADAGVGSDVSVVTPGGSGSVPGYGGTPRPRETGCALAGADGRAATGPDLSGLLALLVLLVLRAGRLRRRTATRPGQPSAAGRPQPNSRVFAGRKGFRE